MPKITWLVSDDELVLGKFNNIRSNSVARYDEIGIHCTISKKFRLDEIDETTASQYLAASIKMMNNFEIKPSSSRIMGCTSNNSIMSCLPKVGIKVDSSAIPSRKRQDNIAFDWIGTPTHPYFPDIYDYRIEGSIENEDKKILEVPLSTILTRTSYDKEPMKRYLDFSFQNRIIQDQIENLVQNTNLVVGIIHSWLLMENPIHGELISYDILDFIKNLSSLLQACDSVGKKIRCVTLSELRSIYT